MVTKEWEKLEEEFRVQKALNTLMHLQGKKLIDDLYDLTMEHDSLMEKRDLYRQRLRAQKKEIEEKDWTIWSRDH